MTGLSAPGRYRDWSMAGWRQHVPGVADVPAFIEGLAGDTIPGLAAAAAAAAPDRVAVTVDGEPVTHAELDDGDRVTQRTRCGCWPHPHRACRMLALSRFPPQPHHRPLARAQQARAR